MPLIFLSMSLNLNCGREPFCFSRKQNPTWQNTPWLHLTNKWVTCGFSQAQGWLIFAPQKGKNDIFFFFSDRHAMKTSTRTHIEMLSRKKMHSHLQWAKLTRQLTELNWGTSNVRIHTVTAVISLNWKKKKNLHHYSYISQLHPLFPCFPSYTLTFTPCHTYA